MRTQTTKTYVIDDNKSFKCSFAGLFRSENLLVDTFSSPDEFLALPRGEENACIVADPRIPGSTGFDLAERLTSCGIKTPLIIISGSDDAQTRERVRELGALAVFRKPADDQALLDTITWTVSGIRNK